MYTIVSNYTISRQTIFHLTVTMYASVYVQEKQIISFYFEYNNAFGAQRTGEFRTY